jgi:hypothetical protein
MAYSMGRERGVGSCHDWFGFWSSALLLQMVIFWAPDTFHFLTLGTGFADPSVSVLSVPSHDRVGFQGRLGVVMQKGFW